MMKATILERLDNGELIIGDGGLTYMLERRGYVTTATYTSEVCVQHPDAVREVHREFALCGSDVLEACVFNGSEGHLNVREDTKNFKADDINKAGCELVSEVAKEYGCIIAGPITPTIPYTNKLGKEAVQAELQKQVDVFMEYNVDFLLGEYFGFLEEALWAAEVMKGKGLPVALSLCIGPMGDQSGVPVEECGIKLVQAGVDIVGVNCHFEPDTCVETTIKMMDAIKREGLKAHYMCQPLAYRTFGAGIRGIMDFPETPLAMESRLISRWDAQKFARKAYDAGIRYIGGCCGWQPYHIRALAEELHVERGRLPINSRGINASSLAYYTCSRRERANKDYWFNLVPSDGREPSKTMEVKEMLS